MKQQIIDNPKTSILGLIGLIVLMVMLFALFTKRIDATDFAAGLSAVGAFLFSINALLSQDAKAKEVPGGQANV